MLWPVDNFSHHTIESSFHLHIHPPRSHIHIPLPSLTKNLAFHCSAPPKNRQNSRKAAELDKESQHFSSSSHGGIGM